MAYRKTEHRSEKVKHIIMELTSWIFLDEWEVRMSKSVLSKEQVRKRAII